MVVVLNAIFNNILAILWRSILVMEKTTDLPQVTYKLYHIMMYWVDLFKLSTLVVIDTYCIG